ncbi:N-acetylglucosamine-6-phosphate deacetylase [Brucella pituitosa]|uniref:Amidohydrolase family protein n=1 Tax=Brucella pituitosa TaxID=571256 RepID=A0ABS3K619_9HYPH|nr:amidohydrolase family protein [Brucella pituitosa]MBO1042352.1 amidohydrolase family protein [Brucella pituitosa]
MKTRWTNVTVVTPRAEEAADLLIVGERIAAIVPVGSGTSVACSSDWRVLDGGGGILFPGIIDLLQHGYGAHLYNDAEADAVADNGQLLLRNGVTGFLPSISCLPPMTLEPTLGRLADQIVKAASTGGTRALGLHSEGPVFGSPGAHNPENIQLPSVGLADRMIAAAGGHLKAVTVAPEMPGAEGFIRRLKAEGISVHLGHSRARPEDIPRYVGWGIDAVTHMFNVMPTYPPGDRGVHVVSLSDALLAEPGLALGLVCDGIHVDPQLVRLLGQLPENRLFLETDAMKFTGTAGATFEFFPGYRVTSMPGRAVREESSGGLCGSCLTSDEAVRNYLAYSGQSLVRAAHAASLVPARLLGIEPDLGSLESGKLADFTLLDRVSLTPKATWVGGREVWGIEA